MVSDKVFWAIMIGGGVTFTAVKILDHGYKQAAEATAARILKDGGGEQARFVVRPDGKVCFQTQKMPEPRCQ